MGLQPDAAIAMQMAAPAFHYHLVCYVGPDGERASPFEGWATFAQIYQSCPNGCRFAIARSLELTQERGEVVNRLADNWVCWDFQADELLHGKHTRGGPLRTPAPCWTSDSLDGLVMKAIALHG